MIQWFKDKWDSVKSWFKYSESIALARLEALSGFLIAAIAGLNWEAVLSWDFSNGFNKEFLFAGLGWFAKGLIQEWLRRRNDLSMS